MRNIFSAFILVFALTCSGQGTSYRGNFTGNGGPGPVAGQTGLTNIPPTGLQHGATTPSSGNFYRGDGTWQPGTGGGNVFLPPQFFTNAQGQVAITPGYNTTNPAVTGSVQFLPGAESILDNAGIWEFYNPNGSGLDYFGTSPGATNGELVAGEFFGSFMFSGTSRGFPGSTLQIGSIGVPAPITTINGTNINAETVLTVGTNLTAEYLTTSGYFDEDNQTPVAGSVGRYSWSSNTADFFGKHYLGNSFYTILGVTTSGGVITPTFGAKYQTNFSGASFSFGNPVGVENNPLTPIGWNTLNVLVSNTSGSAITASFPSTWTNSWVTNGLTASIPAHSLLLMTVDVMPGFCTNVSWSGGAVPSGGSGIPTLNGLGTNTGFFGNLSATATNNQTGVAAATGYFANLYNSNVLPVAQFSIGGREDLVDWYNNGATMVLNNELFPPTYLEFLGHYAWRGLDNLNLPETYAGIFGFVLNTTNSELASFVQIQVMNQLNNGGVGNGQPNVAYQFDGQTGITMPPGTSLANSGQVLNLGVSLASGWIDQLVASNTIAYGDFQINGNLHLGGYITNAAIFMSPIKATNILVHMGLNTNIVMNQTIYGPQIGSENDIENAYEPFLISGNPTMVQGSMILNGFTPTAGYAITGNGPTIFSNQLYSAGLLYIGNGSYAEAGGDTNNALGFYGINFIGLANSQFSGGNTEFGFGVYTNFVTATNSNFPYQSLVTNWGLLETSNNVQTSWLSNNNIYASGNINAGTSITLNGVTQTSWPGGGGSSWTGASSQFQWTHTGQLTQTNVTDIPAPGSFNTIFPFVAGVSPYLAILGDSLTSGNGAGNNGFIGVSNWSMFLSNTYGCQFPFFSNTASSGQTAGYVSTNIATVFPYYTLGTGSNGMACVWLGVNDILGGNFTAEQTFTWLTNIYQHAHSSNFLVTAFTVTYSSTNTEQQASEVYRLNNMIRNSSTNWDYLCDVAAFVPPPFNTNVNPALWYVINNPNGETIHLTNYAQQFIAYNLTQVWQRAPHQLTTKYEPFFFGTMSQSNVTLAQFNSTNTAFQTILNNFYFANTNQTFTQSYTTAGSGGTRFANQNSSVDGGAYADMLTENSDVNQYVRMIQVSTGWNASQYYNQNAGQIQVGTDDTVGLDFLNLGGGHWNFYEVGPFNSVTPVLAIGNTGVTNNVPIFGNGTNIQGVIVTNNAKLNYEPYYSGPGTGINGISWAPATNVDIVTTAIRTNFVNGNIYTNTTGSLIFLVGSTTNVDGGVISTGANTFTIAISNTGYAAWSNYNTGGNVVATSISGLIETNTFNVPVDTNGVYMLSTTASGSGNSSGLIPGTGQIVTIGNATASGVSSLGGNNVFTGNNTFIGNITLTSGTSSNALSASGITVNTNQTGNITPPMPVTVTQSPTNMAGLLTIGPIPIASGNGTVTEIWTNSWPTIANPGTNINIEAIMYMSGKILSGSLTMGCGTTPIVYIFTNTAGVTGYSMSGGTSVAGSFNVASSRITPILGLTGYSLYFTNSVAQSAVISAVGFIQTQ